MNKSRHMTENGLLFLLSNDDWSQVRLHVGLCYEKSLVFNDIKVLTLLLYNRTK